MKLHPRHHAMASAKCDLSCEIVRLVEKYDLTFGEILYVLAQELKSWSATLVRTERQGDPPKEGR